MGDFYQDGVITTLHNLGNRSTQDLEEELREFRHPNPMGLVLPSLYSELEGPALKNIVQELSRVDYLEEIIIGLDRANESQFKYALEYFSELPVPFRILWNDGPRLLELDAKLKEKGLAPTERGKGRNVWYCFGYAIASGRSKAVALHDCDILTYDRGLLARLFYPIANPQFTYKFCKGYYYRAAEGKLNGRVSRLLVTPLLRALKTVFGYDEYLEYLDSFRYPLAGEFCLGWDLLKIVRIPADWGLEIGVLSEIYRNYSTRRVCQVEIADAYDHKHQDLSLEDKTRGLSRMSVDISKAIFRKMATNGVVFSSGAFRSVRAAYYRIALDFVEQYHSDAVMNGMSLDRHNEESIVNLFAENLMTAGEIFLQNPRETPFMPSWERVISALPDFLTELHQAVELDNR